MIKVETPELDKLAAARSRTSAIQEFLEFMAEKGYELKKTIPSGWCSPDGSERISDEELVERGLRRLSSYDLNRFGLDQSAIVACSSEHWDKCVQFWREVSVWTSKQELETGLWRWERGFELNDIGTEGGKLDKLLYEFIDVDPNKIDDERRALLDAHRQVCEEKSDD